MTFQINKKIKILINFNRCSGPFFRCSPEICNKNT